MQPTANCMELRCVVLTTNKAVKLLQQEHARLLFILSYRCVCVCVHIQVHAPCCETSRANSRRRKNRKNKKNKTIPGNLNRVRKCPAHFPLPSVSSNVNASTAARVMVQLEGRRKRRRAATARARWAAQGDSSRNPLTDGLLQQLEAIWHQ